MIASQDQIENTSIDDILRHAVELRRFRILNDDPPAGMVDRNRPFRAIAAATGEDDGNGTLPFADGE